MTTLANAVAAAIAHGNDYTDIRPARWSETYGCGVEAVKTEWERQQWQRTQVPSNTCEVPDGK